MKRVFVIAAALCLCLHVSAQEKRYVVNPGQRISDVIPASDIYQYPSFAQGTISYNDGTSASGMMNYNLLVGMQFVNPNGDTVVIDPSNTRIISLNGSNYIFNKGYLQILDTVQNCFLVHKEYIRQSSTSKVGLYGQTVDGGAASTYSSFGGGSGKDVSLVVNEKVNLAKESDYFLLDDHGRLLPATKKNVEKALPGKAASVDAYLAQTSVDFKNEAQLRGLFAYLRAH